MLLFAALICVLFLCIRQCKKRVIVFHSKMITESSPDVPVGKGKQLIVDSFPFVLGP